MNDQEQPMPEEPFGFDQPPRPPNVERRSGMNRRRVSDRRAGDERRKGERRVQAAVRGATDERRNGLDRRRKQRRRGPRRSIEERRDSAWTVLEEG
jgi:hypothetical protein